MYRTTFYTFNDNPSAVSERLIKSITKGDCLDFDEAFEILSAQKRQKASDYIGCLLLSQSPMVIDLTCLIEQKMF
jgi:hypothetical protein